MKMLLLSTYPQNVKLAWNQHAPYNRYCFTESGQQALAGCVAIAAAQALTVLQPSNFPGITSWEEIVKPNPSAAATDEIAHSCSLHRTGN